jgi:hypothetical protein
MSDPTYKLDSKEITNLMGRMLFEKGHSPIAPNFMTYNLHECDIISVTKDNYTYEYEIKVSLADFKADFRKVIKHECLAKGKGVIVHQGKRKGQITHLICNYFYYVCPACLIEEYMVPEYAGLIWVHYDGRIEYKKQAPRLHSIPADDKLLRKIAHNLTQKNLFGKSYVTMKIHEQKEMKQKKLQPKKGDGRQIVKKHEEPKKKKGRK